VIPGNPRVRLRSQSPGEYWGLAIAAVLAVISINLMSAGGLSEQFGRAFFVDSSTAAETFRKYGSERVVLVQVEGMHSHTSQRVRGVYRVIEATSQDVIAEDEGGTLYKIGSAPDVQIRPTVVKTSLGDRLTIQSQVVNLQSMAVSDWLQRVPRNAYLSGSLRLDDGVSLSLGLEAYPTLRGTGGLVELSNARPFQVRSLLGESWVEMGRVIVKVRGVGGWCSVGVCRFSAPSLGGVPPKPPEWGTVASPKPPPKGRNCGMEDALRIATGRGIVVFCWGSWTVTVVLSCCAFKL